MHELGIVEEMAALVSREAEAHGAKRVLRITVEVGALSGVAADSLQFYWPFVTAGTVSEGSEMDVVMRNAEAVCGSCGRRYAPEVGDLRCPACRSVSPTDLTGDQVVLTSMEVDGD